MQKWLWVLLLRRACIASEQATDHAVGADSVVPLEAPPPPQHSALTRFEFLGPVLRMELPRDTPPHLSSPGGPARDGQHFARQLTEHLAEKFKDAGKLGSPHDWLLDGMRMAWQAKMSPAFFGRALGQMLSESGPSLFPRDIQERYKPMKLLGQGSFATTYLAKDKLTGHQVAVKVLMAGKEGVWLTPSDYAKGGAAKTLIDMSKEECQAMMKVHTPTIDGMAATDMEGGEHVSKCVFDGIQEALNDPSSKKPLFIVMEYAGEEDLDKWWRAALRFDPQGPPLADASKRQARKDLRFLTRQMMQGLDYMANPKRDVKWSHHDLKPQNIVVDGAKKLTIVDMGTALSSDNANGTSPCTPFFRPPEHAGVVPAVGFSRPYHSFDMFSAALTVLALVAGPGGQMSPNFYVPALLLGVVKMLHFRTFVTTANCVSEELEAQSIDPAKDVTKWVEIILKCAGQVTSQSIAAQVVARIEKVRRSSRGAARRLELMRLLGCAWPSHETSQLQPSGNEQARILATFQLQPSDNEQAPILQAVVGEWEE